MKGANWSKPLPYVMIITKDKKVLVHNNITRIHLKDELKCSHSMIVEWNSAILTKLTRSSEHHI